MQDRDRDGDDDNDEDNDGDDDNDKDNDGDVQVFCNGLPCEEATNKTMHNTEHNGNQLFQCSTSWPLSLACAFQQCSK